MDRHDYKCGGAYAKALRGEELPFSKLTEQNVRDIRKLHQAKLDQIASINRTLSAKALAKRYNVHVRTVEAVLAYKTWKHIKD